MKTIIVKSSTRLTWRVTEVKPPLLTDSLTLTTIRETTHLMLSTISYLSSCFWSNPLVAVGTTMMFLYPTFTFSFVNFPLLIPSYNTHFLHTIVPSIILVVIIHLFFVIHHNLKHLLRWATIFGYIIYCDLLNNSCVTYIIRLRYLLWFIK